MCRKQCASLTFICSLPMSFGIAPAITVTVVNHFVLCNKAGSQVFQSENWKVWADLNRGDHDDCPDLCFSAALGRTATGALF